MRKPEETGPDACLHGQPSETVGGNGSTTQSRSRDYSEASSIPAKNSYGSIVVMICDYRLNSKNFVHDDCTCFVRFTQASYKRRGFNKSRL